MFTSFFAPYVGYVGVLVAVAFAASFMYIKRLRTINAELRTEMAALREAYNANLVALAQYKAAYEQYTQKIEQQTKVDVAAADQKVEDISKTKTIIVNDADALTQAEIDAINGTRKNKGKK